MAVDHPDGLTVLVIALLVLAAVAAIEFVGRAARTTTAAVPG